jgi:hypothetical protein
MSMTWKGVHPTTKKFRFTASQLEGMPTLSQGHMEDLKISEEGVDANGEKWWQKTWLSRMTKEDGMPYDNRVVVERSDSTTNWKYVVVDEYPG